MVIVDARRNLTRDGGYECEEVEEGSLIFTRSLGILGIREFQI